MKKSVISLILAASMLCLFATALLGCSGQDKIVGVWKVVTPESQQNTEWEFTSNGRFTWDIQGGLLVNGTWEKSENGKYFCTVKSGTFGLQYSFYVEVKGKNMETTIIGSYGYTLRKVS